MKILKYALIFAAALLPAIPAPAADSPAPQQAEGSNALTPDEKHKQIQTKINQNAIENAQSFKSSFKSAMQYIEKKSPSAANFLKAEAFGRTLAPCVASPLLLAAAF
ncbi:MAG: hypothetical protein J6T16_02655 [Opitutales bacterium]|nr:hypothetical protein [Opitutales bacterium]